MQIKKGEIYGFIGKNGAGKTTLMRLILGAAMPTAGSIELFGGEESENEARHRIGALLEYPCIYKNCTALENLRRFAILTGTGTDELEDILDLVGLKGVGKKKAGQFSLGMKQRLAIGIALLLGFQFPKNFDSPYKSASITEFWRRWHISLSSWLKDYLYISLGGNRHGKFRQYFNLLMTMLLGGLWHGASLNFILWGGFHGILLCLDKIWHSLCGVLSPLTYLPSKRNPNPTKNWFVVMIGGVVTFHLVAALWVLFRAPSFGIAEQMFYQIWNKFEPQIFFQWFTSYKAVALLMLLGYVLHFMPEFISGKAKEFVARCPLVVKAILIVVLVFIVIQIKSSDVQPFIYFQF